MTLCFTYPQYLIVTNNGQMFGFVTVVVNFKKKVQLAAVQKYYLRGFVLVMCAGALVQYVRWSEREANPSPPFTATVTNQCN